MLIRIHACPLIVVVHVQTFYKDSIAPILARWVLRFFTRRHKIKGSNTSASGSAGASDDGDGVDSIDNLTSEQLLEYLLRIPGANTDLEQHISSCLAPDTVAMLNLGHDWLRSYLPHCLSKINRVSFGLLSASQVPLVLIPVGWLIDCDWMCPYNLTLL